jgi:chromosome partitioning protein
MEAAQLVLLSHIPDSIRMSICSVQVSKSTQEIRPIYYAGDSSLGFYTLMKCIAFHSYKGGTGKTTLAANFAALLAKKGYHVFLLDLDVYAPSLQSYFHTDPKKWINDFLFKQAELKEVVVDLTSLIKSRGGSSTSSNAEKCGKLWVGFCNAKKEEIFKLEDSQATTKLSVFRRFILLKELLLSSGYEADYIIIDTSPGIRYWSINALVVADVLLLTLKVGDVDIAGTRELVTEIYGSLKKFGAMSFLLLNRVSGYCHPYSAIGSSIREPALKPKSWLPEKQQASDTNIQNFLTNETGLKVLSAIPCFCDIQFSRKEFLTVLNQPEHLFAKRFEQLVHAIETI